jgi:hypothetical protein
VLIFQLGLIAICTLSWPRRRHVRRGDAMEMINCKLPSNGHAHRRRQGACRFLLPESDAAIMAEMGDLAQSVIRMHVQKKILN